MTEPPTTSEDRSLLGVADVPDDVLEGMVADLLGRPSVEVADVRVEPVAYEVPSLTTVGRHWVSGTTTDGDRFRLFVKHVQAWHHHPVFQQVPPEVRELAAASYPWDVEAAVYRSDLGDRLPPGLSMPRALGVLDRPSDSVVLWLETVEHPDHPWDPERFERAARLLGRLSASPAVAPVADIGCFEWSVVDYVEGRLRHDVAPQVEADAPWEAPLVHRHFGDELRDRTREACARLDEHAAELVTLPHLASHGDATPGNLMAGPTKDDFVLIDFGLWLSKPVGFDLGQLVGGDVQLGRLPAIPLEELDERCVAAYAHGLADEGLQLDLDVVRRAHALHLFLFSGVSALPEPDMPEHQVAARAALARLSLDLLDRTG